MPFIIAGLAYAALVGLAVIPVVVGLARGWRPGVIAFAAAIGSAGGFVFGCGAAVLALVAGAGGPVGATLIVTPCGLAGAVAGAVAGAAGVRWLRSNRGVRLSKS